jgi:hypothetical protein
MIETGATIASRSSRRSAIKSNTDVTISKNVVQFEVITPLYPWAFWSRWCPAHAIPRQIMAKPINASQCTRAELPFPAPTSDNANWDKWKGGKSTAIFWINLGRNMNGIHNPEQKDMGR